MPNWYAHLIATLILSLIFFQVLNQFYFISFEKFLLALIIILIMSLLPDLDSNKSKMRNIFSLLSAAGISLVISLLFPELWFYSIIYFFVFYFVFRHFPTKHRGFMHTFKFSFIFSLLVALSIFYVFSISRPEVLFWFSIIFFSYSFHIVLDKI